ncbi:MAG TPA: Do family serine endopeptidase [Bacteroidales bacterium]
MNTKRVVGMISLAFLGGLLALFTYTKFFDRPKVVFSTDQPQVRLTQLPANYNPSAIDFTYAAERTVHAVVHVKVVSMQRESSGNSFYDFFFGFRDSKPEPVAGFGSGVIISNDGYIVTNNHVIDGADEISVTLNDKRTFKAKLVGRDPDTDIAIIKIDAKDLSYIPYGNSDDLKVGEWVLAVGNPYNLTSTVTAGIVSAKARNLSLLNGGRGFDREDNNYAIESFIQTDAAVNPGNSGGALVNTRGELVGINTAIASPTGSYIGNSFAIPVTIVKKVAADLIEYGKVQRALLGVTITDITSDVAKEKGIDKIEGVLVNGVSEGGAAQAAGIKDGDIILSVNGLNVNSTSELQEQISRYRPNDKVDIIVSHENKKKQISVTLRNMEGNTKIITRNEVASALGAQFAEVSASELNKLGIKNGVKVLDPGRGRLREEGILKGFVITSINGKSVESAEEVKKVLSGTKGVINLEGVYPNGVVASYAFSM